MRGSLRKCAEDGSVGASEKWVQAHNLKVVGSNPTPATKQKPATSMRWRVFSCANSTKNYQKSCLREMPLKSMLSRSVSPGAGASMSHGWHMESGLLFAKCSGEHCDAMCDSRPGRNGIDRSAVCDWCKRFRACNHGTLIGGHT